MHTARSFRALALVLVALFTLTACGDDSPTGPSSGSDPGTTVPPSVDVTGTWRIVETINSPACEEFGTYESTVSIVQDGANLTVSTPVGVFGGTVNDRTIRWTGRYDDDGGQITIESMSLNVASDGRSFTGSASWTWRAYGENYQCSGTTSVSGTRQSSGRF